MRITRGVPEKKGRVSKGVKRKQGHVLSGKLHEREGSRIGVSEKKGQVSKRGHMLGRWLHKREGSTSLDGNHSVLHFYLAFRSTSPLTVSLRNRPSKLWSSTLGSRELLIGTATVANFTGKFSAEHRMCQVV